MQDYQLLEKLAHQNRERIPERTVHAKGSAPTAPSPSRTTSRSTRRPASSPRSASRPRRCCAFPPWRASAARPMPSAMCAASPSSFTPRRATGTWSATTRRSFSCAIRSSSPISSTRKSASEDQSAQQPTAMWDFWSLSPESLHQVTILMSDRGCRRATATSTATAATPTASSTPPTSASG
jgi:catalase